MYRSLSSPNPLRNLQVRCVPPAGVCPFENGFAFAPFNMCGFDFCAPSCALASMPHPCLACT